MEFVFMRKEVEDEDVDVDEEREAGREKWRRWLGRGPKGGGGNGRFLERGGGV